MGAGEGPGPPGRAGDVLYDSLEALRLIALFSLAGDAVRGRAPVDAARHRRGRSPTQRVPDGRGVGRAARPERARTRARRLFPRLDDSTLLPPRRDGTVVDDASIGGIPGGPPVDTHCHLFLSDDDLEVVAAAAGGRRGAPDLRRRGPRIEPPVARAGRVAARGVRHGGRAPARRLDLRRAAGSRIEELLFDPLVVGVGETRSRLLPDALARPRTRSGPSGSHIALARETGKPLVVHVRDAWPDALRVLEEESAERVVLHCFSGDETWRARRRRAGTSFRSPATSRTPNGRACGRRRARRRGSIARRDRQPVPRRRRRCADARTRPRTR